MGGELAVIECKVTCSRDSKGRAPSLGASDKPEPGDISARHQGHTSVKSRVAPKIHSAPRFFALTVTWHSGQK